MIRGLPRRLSTLVGLSAALLLPVLFVSAPAHAASSPLVFLQFNMCGQESPHGCGYGLTVAQDVERSVLNHSPQPSVITLEEVCRSQYDHMYLALGPYYGHFETTVPHLCGDGTDYGVAILLRTSSFTFLGGWELPHPAGGEIRHLSCLQTHAFETGGQPLVACVTHIDTNGTNITAQIKEVARITSGYWSGNHVMVGGDFNVDPDSPKLNPMYHTSYTNPTGTGIFNEADSFPSHTRAGANATYQEYTSCGGHHTGCGGNQAWLPQDKIDYVFFSDLDFYSYSADATYATHSDHAPLWATATMI
jgi:endonuclease/exonuclease/phosphatase family metal-dependent hydrolase